MNRAKEPFQCEREQNVTAQNDIPQGLYRNSFEHDNCGIGAIVNIKGVKSHSTVAGALEIVEHLEHRAGKDAEGKTGDGVGILLQISHKFFQKVCKPLGIELKGERDYGVGMFFLPQDELKRNQAKNFLKSLSKKRASISSDGEKCRYIRMCWEKQLLTVCHVLCRRLSNVRIR